jgi:hypothetical protein
VLLALLDEVEDEPPYPHHVKQWPFPHPQLLSDATAVQHEGLPHHLRYGGATTDIISAALRNDSQT